MTFNQFSLDPRIMKGVETAGFHTPTPIQAQAIPALLQGRDLLGIAQTGTGKTAAFILPILQSLLRNRKKRVRALILAPTRELAQQIYQDSTDLGKHTGIRSVSIYGGVGKKPQLDAVRRGAEIVIACPGRLLDHINGGSIDLSELEILVLDEADRMCDMGFLPDIKRILKCLPKQRQTLFFSATMPGEIKSLAHSILKKPETVQIGMNAPVETVNHTLFPISSELKKPFLYALLKQTATGRVLIFTRTKYKAKSIAQQLKKRKYRVAALQGDMSQNRRQDSIKGFRSGKYDVLVATDIAARGIDVSEITHVINFDMPDTVDAYTHRIGRTGRALNSGEAYTIAVKEDAKMIGSIETVLKKPLQRKQLDGFDYGNFAPDKQFLRKGPAYFKNRSGGKGHRNSKRKPDTVRYQIHG